MAWQTFGDSLSYHPHLHILMTDGVFMPEGDFYGYLNWDASELTGLLRQSILASFTRLGLLSSEAADTMLSWPVERSGFNVHVDTRVDPDDRDQLRTLLRYLTRPPLALDRLHYVERTWQVRYRTRKGAELHYLHAVDLLADLAQHIPPPRRQTVSYHGQFANALGRLESRATSAPDPAAPRSAHRTPWARLILRVWQVDPERCPRCGTLMRRSRAILERPELVRLLSNLGFGRHPPRPPPAPVPEGPPITFGAVGKRRAQPPPQPPSTLAQLDSDISQVSPGWEDQI